MRLHPPPYNSPPLPTPHSVYYKEPNQTGQMGGKDLNTVVRERKGHTDYQLTAYHMIVHRKKVKQ